MSKKIIVILVSLILAVAVAYGIMDTKTDSTSTPQNIEEEPKVPIDEMEAQVVKIFERDCATSGCHRGRYPKAKLNLEADEMVAALMDIPSRQIDSLMLVDSKQPQESYLLMKINGDERIVKDPMPIDAPPLKTEEINLVENWINALAKLQTTEDASTKSQE